MLLTNLLKVSDLPWSYEVLSTEEVGRKEMFFSHLFTNLDIKIADLIPDGEAQLAILRCKSARSNGTGKHNVLKNT